jgi:hypothetical protein
MEVAMSWVSFSWTDYYDANFTPEQIARADGRTGGGGPDARR